MTEAFGTIKRTKLMEILESFLGQDEVHFIRILFSNTILNIKSSSNCNNIFHTNIDCWQGDSLRVCLFIIYLEKDLRTFCDGVDNNHVTSEHFYAAISKSILPDEYKYADDTDLIKNCAEKKKRQLQLVVPTFAGFQFTYQWYQSRTYSTERRWKKNKEWRSTKKLDSLMSDQEDILVENSSQQQSFVTW